MQNVYNQGAGSKFEQSVLAAAEKNAKEIMLKAQKYRSDTLRGINMVQASELNKRCESIKEKNEHRLAKEEQDLRRKLLIYRDELTQQMFQRIEKRLVDLSMEDSFRQSMSRRITKLNDKIYEASDFGHVTQLLVRDSDMDFFCKLVKDDHPLEIFASPEVRLGGFILRIDRLLFDYTLDSSLERAKEKFYKNVDFIID